MPAHASIDRAQHQPFVGAHRTVFTIHCVCVLGINHTNKLNINIGKINGCC